jgi:hypothetical protein
MSEDVVYAVLKHFNVVLQFFYAVDFFFKVLNERIDPVLG